MPAQPEITQIDVSTRTYPYTIALIDSDDVLRVCSGVPWRVLKSKDHHTAYVVRDVCIGGKWTRQFLHRVILNAPKSQKVDHINRNGLDCRKSNLRLCTTSQNGANRAKETKRKTASKYKGVSFVKRDSIWKAAVVLNQQEIYLGRFDLEVDAAKAYDDKAVELFGKFARLNFPVKGVMND